ncbi:MAG: hypothetical protein ABSD08_19040 [Xanthobacteraceae bacterium]
MKIGLHLFAILACGALSTNAAFGGHHSHHYYHHHHYARGAVAHGSGTHVTESAKTGVSTDTAPENAPAADHGHPHGAIPAAGPSGKEGAADTAIDTSFSVYRGQETAKDIKERLVARVTQNEG